MTASPSHAQSQENADVSPGPARGLELWSVLALTGLWIVMISRFGEGDVYSVMGPFACAVCVLCFVLRRAELLKQFRSSWRALLLGLLVGVVMTVLTYPAFQLAAKIIPGLQEQVKALYHGARTTSLARALAWTCAPIVAEELLFRGVLPHALTQLVSERSAYALAILLYGLAQLGSGSLIVCLLAIVCGVIWTVLRVRTESLAPALIAHFIWTPITIFLYPVT